MLDPYTTSKIRLHMTLNRVTTTPLLKNWINAPFRVAKISGLNLEAFNRLELKLPLSFMILIVYERSSLTISLFYFYGQLLPEFDNPIIGQFTIFHCLNCSFECIYGSNTLKNP
jgi:hypothetical protein